MKKQKGILGYPAADLVVGDVIDIGGYEFEVYRIEETSVLVSCYLVGKEISRSTTVRLIRKARGITYAAWQRQTSKLLKAQGLSRWPGAAVMKPLFFMSYSPEDAAAAFLSENFLID